MEDVMAKSIEAFRDLNLRDSPGPAQAAKP
jgi:hypothetical protein